MTLSAFHVTLLVLAGPTPATLDEARASPKAANWGATINAELDAMIELEVWHLTFLPPGSKTIKHKWVFIKKMKSDGTFDKFKARLVACGYSQIHGQNYFETFSPTVSLENVRILLALAAHYDWEAHQVDVQTAFLNAPLAEDVYMTV